MKQGRRTSPEKAAALMALRDELMGTDSSTQRTRLLAALRLYPLTTFEASRYLDV